MSIESDIKDAMAYYSIDLDTLLIKLNITKDELNKIFTSEIPIDFLLSLRLSNLFRLPPSYWSRKRID